jgi:transcription elongation factor SPT5
MSDSEDLSEELSEDEVSSDDWEESKIPKKRSGGKKSKGRKRVKKSNPYIEEAAEEGEEEESEVDSDYQEERRQAEAYTQQLLSKRRQSKFSKMTEEEMAEYYHKLDKNQVVDGNEAKTLTKQQRLPSVQDPKLWLVPCSKGKEREAVINLMNKALLKSAEGDNLSIFSAFCSDHLSDYIYVEAYKLVHVIAAIRGIRYLYEGKVSLVPVKEMPEVFSMDKVSRVKLHKGMFVRVKSGDYKGDVAQIWAVEEQRGKVIVRVVPRLEKSLDRRTRPTAKLFNPKDFTGSESRIDKESGLQVYHMNGNNFLDGFLLKTMSIKSLQTSNVSPSLAEIQLFQTGIEEEEKAAVPVSSRKVVYSKSDKVRVVKGDLKNLTGRVFSATESTVTLVPDILELSDQKLEFPGADVSKYFEQGDHVKVLNGRYARQTGMVVANNETSADIMCDISRALISALYVDLQLTEEVSSGIVVASNYRVNDIVILTSDRVYGIVTTVSQDFLEIMLDNGEVRSIQISEVSRKFSPNKASSVDREGNSLGLGDVVKVTYPAHEYYELTGTIKNALKGTLFLSIPSVIEKGGLVAVKASMCGLLGVVQARPTVDRNEYMQKFVRVLFGPYKGQSGRVVELLNKRVRLELMSSNKTITVDLDAVEALGKATDGSGTQSLADAMRTPAHSPGWTVGTPANFEMTSPWRDTPKRDTPRQDWWKKSPSASSKY